MTGKELVKLYDGGKQYGSSAERYTLVLLYDDRYMKEHGTDARGILVTCNHGTDQVLIGGYDEIGKRTAINSQELYLGKKVPSFSADAGKGLPPFFSAWCTRISEAWSRFMGSGKDSDLDAVIDLIS